MSATPSGAHLRQIDAGSRRRQHHRIYTGSDCVDLAATTD